MSQLSEVNLSLPLTDAVRIKSQPRCTAMTWRKKRCKSHGAMFGLCATHYRINKRFKVNRFDDGSRD